MKALPVTRIVTPTPYAVGPVNAYLVEAEPLTLIDSGVNTPEAQNALLLAITGAGFFPQAVERVLVTHAHPDHYGLVHVIQEMSGATVYFPERELARVRDRQMLFEVGRLLLEAGMPLDLLFKMDQQRRNEPRPGFRGEEVIPVADGDEFAFKALKDEGPEEFAVSAHLMPGHTGGHLVYVEHETGTMFAGDHLLPEVSPNPLLEPSLDEPGTRRRSLKEYLQSLEKMRAMRLRLVYPGHGDPIEQPERLIDWTIGHHLERKEEIARLLTPQGKTPYEIASRLYPDASGYESFLAVSETVAHLDLVVEDGGAVVERHDRVTYYRSP